MQSAMTVTFVLLAGAAAAQEPGEWTLEPDAYRSIKWGASVDAARDEIGGAQCTCAAEVGSTRSRSCSFRSESKPEQVPARRNCSSTLDVAGVKVSDILWFSRDAFAGATMQFLADDFDKMKEIFTTKYGPPLNMSEEDIQNRLGAHFKNEVLTWNGPKVTVTLQRYFINLRVGSATVATNEWMQQRTHLSDEAKKKGAESF